MSKRFRDDGKDCVDGEVGAEERLKSGMAWVSRT